MLQATNLEDMLVAVLDELLSIFEADRAWLLFPCDPDAPSWYVPMERTVPQWPGALALGEHIPMTPDAAALFEAVLATTSAIAFGPESNPVPKVAAELFSVQAQLVLAIHPKVGGPWCLGLHRCAEARGFVEAETQVFEAVGYRLGDSLSSLLALRDVRASESRLEELVAARTAELTRVNRDLEAFSASVSHDLRAPLRTITGFSKLLVREYAPQLDEDAQSYIGFMQSGCLDMRHLIDDLLMLAKVSAATLSRVSVDLTALAEAQASSLARSAPTRQVDWHIASELSAEADLGLLRIVIQNLLDNAWKFTAKTAAARIEIGRRTHDDADVFYVSDNGAGFDESHSDQLFKPLKRLHSAEEFAGHGIGLGTVRRIIERHGGRVWAEGAPGQGATFSFTLTKA